MSEQRRLAAIVSADVAGYSRLMGRDESGTLAALKALRREVVDPRIAAHNGRIVKTTGDGLLLEFASVVDAVRCVVEVQTAVAEKTADVPEDRRIAFRIGVNIGDIIIDGDDIFGDGVNVAARLQEIAAPGGLCISGRAHDDVRDRLDTSFAGMGEQTLKNIARPIPVWSWLPGDTLAASASAPVLALPDKPSIAVLPFQNMSGDPEQEYFADGLAEDIITELSRFHEFAVIARNSTFFYKGKPFDVAQVARDLRVRYVLEGSVRKAGSRIRVTAQLIDSATSDHLWAERYDREYADVFDLQEEITRTVVASIAPRINLAEVARSRRDTTNSHARQLALRAEGMLWDALKAGDAALMPQTIVVCQEAIAVDPASIAAHTTLASAHTMCHLFRWGDKPESALDRAWSVVERMMAIDAQDARTLTARGAIRVRRGEYEGGLADLRRAHEVNPNYVRAILNLAFFEVTVGLAREAEAHARLALRLSPREPTIGVAHLTLAMSYFALRDFAESARWCESAIQLAHRAPIRRALMIACSAWAGDMTRARTEIAVLDGFAPGFISSVFRGENPIFTRREDMDHLLDGLRLAGLGE